MEQSAAHSNDVDIWGSDLEGLPDKDEIMTMWATPPQGGANPVILLGDTGMGKTHFIETVDEAVRETGAIVRKVSFGGCTEEELPVRFTRFARETIRLSESVSNVVVLVDDMASAGENAYGRIARAIRRMGASSCRVCVALRPECEGLLEALGESALITSGMLLARDIEAEDLALTNAIPKLVIARRSDVARSYREGEVGHALQEGLCEMLRDSLRDSLTREETEMRLVMALLGRGALDDVQKACAKTDPESLAKLERDAPFFRVSIAEGTFSVAGLGKPGIFEACRSAVAEACRSHEVAAVHAAKILSRRGEFRRMGVILDMLGETEGALELANIWGANLVCAGCVGIVARSNRLGDETDPAWMRHAQINSLAIAEVSGKRRDLARLRTTLGMPEPHDQGEREALYRVRMLRRLRKVLTGAPVPETSSRTFMDGQDEMAALCIQAILGIMNGRFLECFDRLLDDPRRKRTDGLVAAMLSDVFDACEALLGERGGAQSLNQVGWSEELFLGSGSGRLLTLRHALVSSIRILVGRTMSFPNIEQTLTQLHNTGDVVMETVCLMAAAVADLRQRALARANVRARRAEMLAGPVQVPYLTAAAQLVVIAIEAAAGEEVSLAGPEALRLSETDPQTGALLDLRRMLSQASRGDTKTAVRLDYLSRATLPREALWAINLLANDCGRASGYFNEMMPSSWKRPLQTVLEEFDLGMEGAARHPVQQSGDEAGAKTGLVGKKPVRIEILGKFSARVNGKEIGTTLLGPRRSKKLVFALALAKGHSLSKHDALCIVWGDYDLDTAGQKLYETVCMARKALRLEDGDAPLLVTGRGSGRISLDTSRIEFDIDEFLRSADGAIMNEGLDRKVISLASKARETYSTGIGELVDDMSGITAARMREIATLHSDAMTAGARSALREGRSYLAAQLAREALGDDPVREDALVTEVSALAIMGRPSEVVNVYRQFRNVLLHTAHLLPSAAVREAVDDALARGGSTLDCELIDKADSSGIAC